MNSSTGSARRCVALIASAFFRSKRAGLALTRVTSKASTISAIEKMSRSSAIDQPSSAR